MSWNPGARMQLGLRSYMESETRTPPASLSCFYASLSFTLFSQQCICLQSFRPNHLKHDCRELLNFIFLQPQTPTRACFNSLSVSGSKNLGESIHWISLRQVPSLEPISCGQQTRSHENLAAWKQEARSKGSK